MSNEEFSRSARRPAPEVKDPMLQWATGLPTADRRLYAGWFTECGKDAALDDAMAAAQYGTVDIKHGGGNVVRHWALEVAEFFVLADGIDTMGQMKNTTQRYGVAFGWENTNGRAVSRLRFRTCLRGLLEVGYAAPLLVTMSGTVTGDMINILMRQYDVLDAVAAFRKEEGKPEIRLPFFACSIPIRAGQEVVRGTKATKEITPPVAAIPSPIDKTYILTNWCTKEWRRTIEPLVDNTIAWSIAESAKIASASGETPYDAAA